MTTRLLPRNEWHRLKGTLLETVSLPRDAEVLVVEADEQIVGCCVFLMQPHVEGAWMAPEHRRKAAVGRRLLAGMRRLVREHGSPNVWMMATNSESERLIQRLGDAARLDCAHFSVGMGR